LCLGKRLRHEESGKIQNLARQKSRYVPEWRRSRQLGDDTPWEIERLYVFEMVSRCGVLIPSALLAVGK
jgi:hypothetical protein